MQSVQPGAQADSGKEHAPAAVQEVAPETCGRFVHVWPQVPQLWMSLGTHWPPHTRFGLAQTKLSTGESLGASAWDAESLDASTVAS